MTEPDFLLFASDATWLAIWGGGFIAIALFSMVAERLRLRRRKIDAVGWIPWTGVFFVCAFIGSALLMVAVKGWLSA